MSFEQRLIEICDRIMTRFGWDMEAEAKSWEETGRRSITRTENLRKALYKAKAEAHNYPLGIVTLYDNIAEDRNSWGASWVNFFGYKNPSDFTIEEIEDQKQFALLILELITLYNDWHREEFAPIMGSLSPEALKIDPTILMKVNKLVNEDHFKCYKYKDSGETINYTDNFCISSVIGFSSDLTRWLNHIQNQQEFLSNQEPNKVFITLFGKMDEVHPLYSNWLFTLHKGNTIWIVTDKVDFDNPYQKHARLGRRSAWRDRDELTGICDLPYELFEEIDNLRPQNILTKNSHFDRHFFPQFKKQEKEKLIAEFKRILDENHVEYDTCFDVGEEIFFDEWQVNELYAKQGGTVVAYATSGQMIIYKYPEVLFKDFDTIAPGSQVFAKLLCSELIKHLGSNAETPAIMLAAEHLEMKLIEGAQIDPIKASHMTYWTAEAKEIFDELIETIDDGKKSTAVTKKTYDVIKSIPTYNASWLSTPDKLSSLAEWMVLDRERKALSPKIKALADTKDEAWKWFYNTFNAHYNQIISRITSAQTITFRTSGYRRGTFTTEANLQDAGRIIQFFGKGVDAKRGRGIGKTEYREQECRMCEKDKIKPATSTTIKRIQIRHYRELMWILGFTDRKQLPKYFRQYRAHDMIPYSGNSILDQTHPYLDLQDPCSRNHRNGITIDAYMCKVCYNKISKAKPETLTVTY